MDQKVIKGLLKGDPRVISGDKIVGCVIFSTYIMAVFTESMNILIIHFGLLLFETIYPRFIWA